MKTDLFCVVCVLFHAVVGFKDNTLVGSDHRARDTDDSTIVGHDTYLDSSDRVAQLGNSLVANSSDNAVLIGTQLRAFNSDDAILIGSNLEAIDAQNQIVIGNHGAASQAKLVLASGTSEAPFNILEVHADGRIVNAHIARLEAQLEEMMKLLGNCTSLTCARVRSAYEVQCCDRAESTTIDLFA